MLKLWGHHIWYRIWQTLCVRASRDNGLVVRNLYDEHQEAIKVLAGNRSIQVGVFQEVGIGANSKDLLDKMKLDAVARRRIRAVSIGKGLEMVRSEVSMISLMQETQFFPQLIKGEGPIDSAILSKLIKMSACCAVATPTHGSYTRLSPRE